ncbi:phosphoribosyltransferase family protein [Undibacterium cyanobacteriorum]|uniref:Phosphoribosyltransferase family protein n=1 Tax=Undibacterium cyanobacteriorum TaxID=3073561 RepID=A0ABY9RJ40_9BURK|nr:phosphoribosyltransferase family protein [Undibacterium sp. 20NA77.5]WMW80367.1 phosphoribosyltransferase family protein [Undibacterium sp. 20NA77.5]
MAQTIRDQLLQLPEVEFPDLIIPLPLGSIRLQQRGFNQSMEIARHLAQQIGVDIQPTLLRRIKETLAQSELDTKRRLANVRRAFLISPDKLGAIENLHVALVDDVMTTGTTLNAAAQELKNAGARKVSNFVFARTPKSRTPSH